MNLLGYWDQWVGRRAALDLIRPLVARTELRSGPIPEIAWRQPYVIGFLTMLISLVAVERTRGRLTGNRLGMAQLAVWHEIAALADDRVGEDILLLSANGDEAFLEGCHNARRFLAVMRQEASLGDLGLMGDWQRQLPLADPPSGDSAPEGLPGNDRTGEPHALVVWDLLFEARLMTAGRPNAGRA